MWELNLKGRQFRWPGASWVGISGPSGCGKTQLLKQLAAGTGGQLRCNGENLLQHPPSQRGIGWATQGAALWPNQRVGQQLGVIAGRHRWDNWQELARALSLEPLFDKPTHVLSGGERQRVALLCALICAKTLLLLDEPVSALDQGAAAEVLMVVRHAARQRQLSALVVSHQWRDIAASCDYCYYWSRGTLLDIDSAQREFSHQFPDQAAALWPVQWSGDGKQLIVAGQIIEAGPLPGNISRVSIDAHEVSLARHRPGPSSIANTLEVSVSDIRTLDSGSALVSLLWRNLTLYSLITTKSVRELALAKGQRVFAQFKAHAVKTPQARSQATPAAED